MRTEGEPGLEALREVLRGIGRVAVAVSGGVDSTTLAALAHRLPDCDAEMFHAISPAVPPEGTARVRTLAEREGWRLHTIDAGEFASADYVRNPLERCFYCKQSLYGTISPRSDAQVVSGTNLDDLGDYRPGLRAARGHGVRHPFVEAWIDKAGVRAIAHTLGLEDLAELPASPCLSSRIETGIPIDARVLEVVHRVERLVERQLRPRAVRCRVRERGVVVELDSATLGGLSRERAADLCAAVTALWREAGLERTVALEPYRMGSAFLHPAGG